MKIVGEGTSAREGKAGKKKNPSHSFQANSGLQTPHMMKAGYNDTNPSE